MNDIKTFHAIMNCLLLALECCFQLSISLINDEKQFNVSEIVQDEGLYEILYKGSLGQTEIEAVVEMSNGVREIIKLEQDLQIGKIPKMHSCAIV